MGISTRWTTQVAKIDGANFDPHVVAALKTMKFSGFESVEPQDYPVWKDIPDFANLRCSLTSQEL